MLLKNSRSLIGPFSSAFAIGTAVAAAFAAFKKWARHCLSYCLIAARIIDMTTAETPPARGSVRIQEMPIWLRRPQETWCSDQKQKESYFYAARRILVLLARANLGGPKRGKSNEGDGADLAVGRADGKAVVRSDHHRHGRRELDAKSLRAQTPPPIM